MKKILVIVLTLFALLLMGCGTINVNHKLHSDWTSDITLEVVSESEPFINLVKTGLESSLPGAVEIETEDGVMYQLENVKASDLAINQTTVFNSFGIKKEFKFPNYYYTLTWDMSGSEEEDSASQVAGMGIGFNYILTPFGKITDTNGVYVGEDKKAVKFNMLSPKKYYVTFKQSFVSAWLSGSSKVTDRDAVTVAGSPIGETDSETLDW
ncbi:MAG TPA: hypothetical protein VK158_02625 [Acidobacteriota bacterium]|nr:hypothetical protein [Acidobacteriota bacterium]